MGASLTHHFCVVFSNWHVSRKGKNSAGMVFLTVINGVFASLLADFFYIYLIKKVN